MHIVLTDLDWMSFNVFLAMIPVLAGFFMWKIKNKLVKGISFLVWFFFVPNTIYLFTDLVHLFDDLSHVTILYRVIIMGLYMSLVVIGLFTFILSMYCLRRFLRTLKVSNQETTILLLVELVCIAFGMVLGRVERANSWDIVHDPIKLVHQSQHVITSVPELMLFISFFILVNMTYLFSRQFFRTIKK